MLLPRRLLREGHLRAHPGRLALRRVDVAVPLMILLGALAGFFVVPMNALLQHRGHILMGAGHSIAVQNFNENLSILAMLGFYALPQPAEAYRAPALLAFYGGLALLLASLFIWYRYVPPRPPAPEEPEELAQEDETS